MNFNVNKNDTELIGAIVSRGFKKMKDNNFYPDPLSMLIDLSVCHANGCPLKLKELLSAPDFDFYHDLCGIAHNINRNTGQLENCFSPRFSAPQEKPAN